MANLARRLLAPREERNLPFQQWFEYFSFNGNLYSLNGGVRQTLMNDPGEVGADLNGLSGAFRTNAVVFACCQVRQQHFAEARFQYRRIRNGRPGDLWGDGGLRILERPWENATTGDLLTRMLSDVDRAGNSYIVNMGGYLARLQPDWTDIILGSRSGRDTWIPGDPDTRIVGYHFQPGGSASGAEPMIFDVSQVAHFAPITDPLASFRGMSWITPLIREIQGDSMMTQHKNKFLEQGATVNMVVKVPAETLEKFDDWVRKIREGHDGLENAYKTLFLGGGADATPVGSDLQQMDFKAIQGAGETRIAAAAGVHPVIVGLSEGLEGSSLNAGNYQAARRRFADGTLRPLWRNAAGSLASIVRVPRDSELWYDDRDIAFLKEDLKDTAEVQQLQASAAKSLIDSGFKPDAIIDALQANDLGRLVGQHTGLTSVQLVPPGTGGTAPLAA